MTNLKRGKLFIRNEDILNFMGLSSDTHIEAVQAEDGIEIKVIANNENNKEWLISHSEDTWYGWGNYRRYLVPLSKYIPIGAGKSVFKIYTEDGQQAILETDNQEIALFHLNSLKEEGWKALVKEEVVGFKK